MSIQLLRRSQIALGVLWLIDGALQFQGYMFGKTFVTGILLPSAGGQPSFIAGPIAWIAHLIEPRVAIFNGFAATLEVLIGVGLLYRPTVKPALAASFVWAGGIWFAGEGLGMLFTGTASPLTGAPGAAVLYVLAGLMCWPRQAPADSVQQGRNLSLIGDRGARLAWSAIWLSWAALWLLPANTSSSSVHSAIASAPSGTRWFSAVLATAATATTGHGAAIAILLSVTSAAIALGLVYGWHPRRILAIQISLAAVYWVLGQGLGGVFTGRATDVGTAPLMILIAVMVSRSSAADDTRRRRKMGRIPHVSRAVRA